MFDDLLKQAGLRKNELADILGIKKGTISTWKGSPPQYAIAYLELYIESRKYFRFFELLKELRE